MEMDYPWDEHDLSPNYLRKGDRVLYNDKPYSIAGIKSEVERAIALQNPEDEMDRGLVRTRDIEAIVEINSSTWDKDPELTARESGMGHLKIFVGLVGRPEPENGVYVLTDDDGYVIYDQDNKAVDPDDQRWNSYEQVDARLERMRQKSVDSDWNGFKP